MDFSALAKELAEKTSASENAWLEALEGVKAQAGRARMTAEKLQEILTGCETPKDLVTLFTTVLNLQREDHSLEDGWAFMKTCISDSDTSLPGWSRAIENANQFLTEQNLLAPTRDLIQYIACTEESPECKNGKAPLATAVNHYLQEYGIDSARPKC